jgi:integrase-like protein/Arm domain-containing DNA-binding protein
MHRKGLTARTVETIGDGWHHDGHGLYLQVTGNGAGRSWVYRYTFDGKQRYIGLGPAHKHAIGLAQARQLAQECRLQRLQGIDPLQAKHNRQDEQRLADAKKITFGQCVENFLEFKRPEWSNPKHVAQWEMTLRQYAKPLHAYSPDKIDLALVVETLRPIWHKVPETASRTRQRIEAVLDHWQRSTTSSDTQIQPRGSASSTPCRAWPSSRRTTATGTTLPCPTVNCRHS